MNNELDKCKGALLGLAIGDALGTTLEFKRPGTFDPITDMVGGGVFNLQAGKWTDDTSMALCLADSLIEKEGFDAFDQLGKYVKWMNEGYNSSTGTCFDIGNATRQALYLYESTRQPYCGDKSRDSAGNGSIMRLAPIPIMYFNDSQKLMLNASLSSQTTHAAPQCIDACIYMSMLMAGAIKGNTKEELLSECFSLTPNFWASLRMDEKIKEIAMGSFKTKEPPQIYASGYVVKPWKPPCGHCTIQMILKVEL
jgi:ADP-ribosylglycohydrolase